MIPLWPQYAEYLNKYIYLYMAAVPAVPMGGFPSGRWSDVEGISTPEAANQSEAAEITKLEQERLHTSLNTWLQDCLTASHGSVLTLRAGLHPDDTLQEVVLNTEKSFDPEKKTDRPTGNNQV